MSLGQVEGKMAARELLPKTGVSKHPDEMSQAQRAFGTGERSYGLDGMGPWMYEPEGGTDLRIGKRKMYTGWRSAYEVGTGLKTCEKKRVASEGSGKGKFGPKLFDAEADCHTSRRKAEAASDA